MLTWFKNGWHAMMIGAKHGINARSKRCCVPYRKDPIHDKNRLSWQRLFSWQTH